jgi:hypothetical protein
MSGEGESSMCDYSLDLVASRPAKVGDKLVTTEFQNSMTRGFAAIGEPNVAQKWNVDARATCERLQSRHQYRQPPPLSLQSWRLRRLSRLPMTSQARCAAGAATTTYTRTSKSNDTSRHVAFEISAQPEAIAQLFAVERHRYVAQEVGAVGGRSRRRHRIAPRFSPMCRPSRARLR